MPSLIGVVGTAFMMVFMSISAAIVAPMQCERHPNGYRTVQAYPQAICWSTDYGNGDTHRHMVILGAIASVVHILRRIVCVVVQQFPVRVGRGDTTFLHAFAFLFFRCNPQAYWYVLVMLGRNLAVAMVPLIADEALQLLCFTLVLGPCVVVCAGVFPWRNHLANIVDFTTNAVFVLILFLAALLVEGADKALIADMPTAFFFLLCSLLALVILSSAYKMMLRRSNTFQFFKCRHKQGGGCFTRLLKLRLKRDLRVKREIFLDADNLQDLNLLFRCVCCGALNTSDHLKPVKSAITGTLATFSPAGGSRYQSWRLSVTSACVCSVRPPPHECSQQTCLTHHEFQSLMANHKGYVEKNTDTLVVICTSEILSRPWCVGEMMTARVHGVDTILVVLPDFTWPTEDCITQYASHVPGVYGLAKFGISVSMAQVTLAWLSTKS